MSGKSVVKTKEDHVRPAEPQGLSHESHDSPLPLRQEERPLLQRQP